MVDAMPVHLPAWAARPLLAVLRQSFTGNMTLHWTNGHLAAVEYSQGRCSQCGNQKRMRIAEQSLK